MRSAGGQVLTQVRMSLKINTPPLIHVHNFILGAWFEDKRSSCMEAIVLCVRTIAMGARDEELVEHPCMTTSRSPENQEEWPNRGFGSTEKNQGSMESQGHRVRKVEWVFILCGIASIQFFCFLRCFRMRIWPNWTLNTPLHDPSVTNSHSVWPRPNSRTTQEDAQGVSCSEEAKGRRSWKSWCPFPIFANAAQFLEELQELLIPWADASNFLQKASPWHIQQKRGRPTAFRNEMEKFHACSLTQTWPISSATR